MLRCDTSPKSEVIQQTNTIHLFICRFLASEWFIKIPLLSDFTRCGIAEVGIPGALYLKEVCYNDETPWYRCAHSSDDDPQYYKTIKGYGVNTCYQQYFDRVCPSDPYFYQACGHRGCSGYSDYGTGNIQLCSTYICDSGSDIFSGDKIHSAYGCNGQSDCSNTAVDESTDCAIGNEAYTCFSTNTPVDSMKVCNLECDCYYCDDEASCNNVTYGLWCDNNYKFSSLVCDNNIHCYNGEDEDCNENNIIKTCDISKDPAVWYITKEGYKNLTENQICSVPDGYPRCIDGLDQVNCSDSSRVALSCPRDGFLTTVSVFGICKGFGICDDSFDDICIEAEGGCTVHKHLLCDGSIDCAGGADEDEFYCSYLTNVSCVRRFRMRQPGITLSLKIPIDWVFDGQIDCEDGSDEDATFWHKCGNGSTERFVEKGSQCQEMLHCFEEEKFVKFEELCDRKNSCGKENDLCLQSRNHPVTWNSVVRTSQRIKTFSRCLKGLDNLQLMTGGCKFGFIFNSPGESGFGAEQVTLDTPKQSSDCRSSYGELYVYSSCSGICENTTCPLLPIPHDTCINKLNLKVNTITKTNQLTTLIRRNGSYTDTIFPCQNKKCVLYEEVCNLVDDCGDASDERHCGNHFFCPGANEYIPISSKCDGKVDCQDLSDECNSACADRYILGSHALKGLAITIGALAVLLNVFSISRSLVDLRRAKLFRSAMTTSLVLLISSGDLLLGGYLLAIAYVDLSYDSYCENRYRWLTSTSCSVLGIFSTIGSQVSLFAMTALSVFRYYTVTSRSMVKESVSEVGAVVKLSATWIVVLASSVVLAVLPVFPTLEDFFVNGLYYNKNPLFTASVSKLTHYEVFKVQYGRFQHQNMAWEQIRQLVREMFTDDYGGMNATHFINSCDSISLFIFD